MKKNHFNSFFADSKFIRYFSFRLTPVAFVVLALAVAFCTSDKDLYKRYRKFPEATFTLNGSEVENNRLKDAAKLFNSGKYDQALTAFTNFLQNDQPNNIEVRYYLALCQLELGNTGYARQVLTNFADSGSDFATDANWFLALTYLREENHMACKQRLALIPVDNKHYKDAQKLLKSL